MKGEDNHSGGPNLLDPDPRRNTYVPGKRLHPSLQGRRGQRAGCWIRIYLPDDVLDAPVVVCSELPNNPGGSITNSAEAIGAGVIRANELPTPLVWIEHWPKESTNGGEETFELVTFSSYELTQRAPYLGETRAWIGEPTWKSLDCATVEVLVKGKMWGKRYSLLASVSFRRNAFLGAAERVILADIYAGASDPHYPSQGMKKLSFCLRIDLSGA